MRGGTRGRSGTMSFPPPPVSLLLLRPTPTMVRHNSSGANPTSCSRWSSTAAARSSGTPATGKPVRMQARTNRSVAMTLASCCGCTSSRMCDRFSQLRPEARVFRLADPGGCFLPAGSVLPLPEWFRPTSADEAEGGKRGRPAGVSVWDDSLTTVDDAKQLADKPGALAFRIGVGRCVAIGRGCERELAVVRDPLDEERPAPGWDGHSLIEGLQRPSGCPKKKQKALLSRLVEACEPVS